MLRIIPSVVVSFALICLGAGCLPVGESKPETKQEKKKPIPRTLLETNFIGKSKNDLREAFGQPYNTSKVGKFEAWRYKEISIDSAGSGKVDDTITFWFKENRDEIDSVAY